MEDTGPGIPHKIRDRLFEVDPNRWTKFGLA
jgi:hypothetical protein